MSLSHVFLKSLQPSLDPSTFSGLFNILWTRDNIPHPIQEPSEHMTTWPPAERGGGGHRQGHLTILWALTRRLLRLPRDM